MSLTTFEVLSPTKRILVVEDDPGLRQMLADYLPRNGVEVQVVPDGAQVMDLVASGGFSLVILDMLLGREDGFDLLRAIRTRSDIPVIVVTGNRTDEVDRVVGLELGADDYVTKPFSPRELLARIRVVLRRVTAARVEAAQSQARSAGPGISRFGRWTLDRARRTLQLAGGADIPLTKGEYLLLLAFLDAPLRPLSREHLINATRVHDDVFDRSIDVQILRLRRKLEADATTAQVIRTERGQGYVFTLAVLHDKA